MKVLFVWAGDTARSQMAEAFYNHITGTQDAASAGTEVIVGKSLPPRILSVMREWGLSMDGQYRKALTRELFDAAEKVVVLTRNSLPDYLQGDKVTFWETDDPRYQEMEVFYRVRDEIYEKVKQLVKEHS